jgi:hypothetical protein
LRANFKTAQARHVDVEHDKVGLLRCNRPDSLGAIIEQGNVVSSPPQNCADEFTGGVIVINTEKQTHAISFSPSTPVVLRSQLKRTHVIVP